MSHRTVIINRVILPSPDANAQAAHTQGELSVQVTYNPADNDTDQQVGTRVGTILKRLNKLADD
jgi:hypothetical protein